MPSPRPLVVSNTTDLCYPIYTEPFVEEPEQIQPASNNTINDEQNVCAQLPPKEHGHWICESNSGENDVFCRLSCEPGYWAPNRRFFCNCNKNSCDWSGRSKVNKITCEKQECTDLMVTEPSEWSCTGRNPSDVCWSPCSSSKG